MNAKLTVDSEQLDKEELRLLIQSIRHCEQKSFPDKGISIWLEAPIFGDRLVYLLPDIDIALLLTSLLVRERVNAKLTVDSEQLDKEELRLLIQSIRDCEQKSFPDKEISIWLEALELSASECKEILASIKPH